MHGAITSGLVAVTPLTDATVFSAVIGTIPVNGVCSRLAVNGYDVLVFADVVSEAVVEAMKAVGGYREKR